MSFIRFQLLTAALLCLSACAPQAEPTPAGSESGVAAASAAQPLAASLAQPLAAPPASAEIPPPFQGYWSDNCQSASSKNQLRIEAREITFFDSRGKVRVVVVRDDDIALITDMYRDREGDEWLAAQTFKLMDHGQTLVDTGNIYAEDGKPMVRKRCAPRPAAGQSSN